MNLQVTLLLLSNIVFIMHCKLIICYNENSVNLVEKMYSQQKYQKVKGNRNENTHWKATMASSTVNLASFDTPLFFPFFFFPEDFFFPDFFLGGMKCV